MRRALPLPILLVAAMLAPAPDEPAPIVEGDEPAQFELVGMGPESVAIRGGEVRLTGKPIGYFATRREYADFALSFEWKYDRPPDLKTDAGFRGNSGLLVRVARPHKVWPRCVEVQLAQSDPGAIFAVGEATVRSRVDVNAQVAATRPVGHWNRAEVTVRGGAIACSINGVEVARGEGLTPDRGAIGWQSEGAPVRFREIRIRPLP